METSMSHQKDAVKSGYWPLYRYKPTVEEHEHPFQLDSAAPSIPLRDFALKEARFSMLARSDPDRSRQLLDLAQEDIDERWRYYEQLAGLERMLHQPHELTAATDGEPGDGEQSDGERSDTEVEDHD
jgi:pyruvate-ferredoxin/flavodoxin oxidoreductase